MSEEKPTPNGTNPSQRLPSFKPPRDLSLGGVKPKKVFIPNLNVSRNKSKSQTSSSQESKKDDRIRGKDRKDRQRSRNGPNIIKSSGVFSEGLGGAERYASRATYSSRESGDPSPQVLQRPTIRVKNFVKLDKELEEQKIKSVMGDTNIPEDQESHEFKRALEIDAPIKLPMDDGGYLRRKQALKIKQEVMIKEEPIDEDERTAVRSIPDVKKETCEIPDIVNLLRSEEPKILMLQFPQSLPGRGNSAEEPPRQRDSAPSTSTGDGDQPTKPVDNTCTISDLDEGKIGKLRVYHSGRVTLKLGDTEFEVSLGTQAAFHQEVVSVAVDHESRSANIISLGSLTHKLNIVPDWERIFKKMNL